MEFTFYPTIYHQRRAAFNMIYPIHVHSKSPGRIKRWSKKFLRKKQIPSNQSWEVSANKYDRIYVMNWFMQRDIFFTHYSSKAWQEISLNISFQAVVMHVIIQCLQKHEKMFYCKGENIGEYIVFSYILQ